MQITDPVLFEVLAAARSRKPVVSVLRELGTRLMTRGYAATAPLTRSGPLGVSGAGPKRRPFPWVGTGTPAHVIPVSEIPVSEIPVSEIPVSEIPAPGIPRSGSLESRLVESRTVANHGGENHGDQNHGDQNHGDKNHGDQNHGDQNHGDKNHGDQNHGNEAGPTAGISGSELASPREGLGFAFTLLVIVLAALV